MSSRTLPLQVTSTNLLDKTVARVTFANGHTMTIESDYEAAQNNGNSYSGAEWTTFGNFSKRVEHDVREAQKYWGLPDAEIRYIHTRRQVEHVIRRTDVERLHTIRTIKRVENA